MVKPNGTPVKQVNTVKYLGVHLDTKLNCKEHTNNIAQIAKIATELIYSYRQ